MNDHRHAIMAVDPGGTTGVAAGYIDLEPGMMMAEAVTSMPAFKSEEVKGSWIIQANMLAAMARRFAMRANVENSLPLDNIHLVFEDFVLRRRKEGGATGNLTSVWVAAAACGAMQLPNPEHEITWQSASDAKSYATDARLKKWGLWVAGSAHERDAWRHLVLKANKILP